MYHIMTCGDHGQSICDDDQDRKNIGFFAEIDGRQLFPPTETLDIGQEGGR